MNPSEVEEKFRRGLEQFNRCEFFNAHETWEEIWLPAPEPEKTFLQGLIQVAAGFHHYTRKNHRGMCSLLEAGLKKLDRFPAAHRGSAIEELRDSVRTWIATLRGGNDPGTQRLPQIQYSGKEPAS